ncbi:hypothetical protein KZZ52_36340 [Dactylosporangium sp. AC04546]|uniref:hypothetical protein n=1 Tax=Dactylosporangium sp. AC04546 TaxID=2862460 RepID=UPI001EDEABD6|nr:hypothetical protein [Dactylosporangium sp. AC04546]WVK79435.1 hypothetical protein KZZ52_36340 [Dactylosporangium sp. AC04546]
MTGIGVVASGPLLGIGWSARAEGCGVSIVFVARPGDVGVPAALETLAGLSFAGAVVVARTPSPRPSSRGRARR